MYISKRTPNFHFNFLTITYSITCELNGGSATNEAAYTIESEDIVLNNPTKTGYTFLGWSGTDIDGMSTNVVIPSGSVGNRAYVAHWEIVIYTIKYELNSGSSSNITMYTIESDVITLNNPTRIGYTFLGWSGTDIEDMSANVVISSGSTGNREYTANWMAIFYCGSNSITGLTNHGKTLEYILIPSSIDGRAIRRIDERAFDSCTNLKSVVIEDGVESIGEYAFV